MAHTKGEVMAVHGKTARRSPDRQQGKHRLHAVSVWATANRLVLRQEQTEEKSNEITAIPKLLAFLELRGCIVTTDAMGCQRAIAEPMIEPGGPTQLSGCLAVFFTASEHPNPARGSGVLRETRMRYKVT